MGAVFVKKCKMGFFCKKWTFPQRRVYYIQYQYYLFYILLIWGCVRTRPAYWPEYAALFCSLAVLDPRVGHTMDVLSPFISVLCHSD